MAEGGGVGGGWAGLGCGLSATSGSRVELRLYMSLVYNINRDTVSVSWLFDLPTAVPRRAHELDACQE